MKKMFYLIILMPSVMFAMASNDFSAQDLDLIVKAFKPESVKRAIASTEKVDSPLSENEATRSRMLLSTVVDKPLKRTMKPKATTLSQKVYADAISYDFDALLNQMAPQEISEEKEPSKLIIDEIDLDELSEQITHLNNQIHTCHSAVEKAALMNAYIELNDQYKQQLTLQNARLRLFLA